MDTTKVQLLVLHRQEAYPGQLSPEILAVCDDVTAEENPAWWAGEIARQRELIGTDAAAWAQVTVELDRDALMGALYPSIAATIAGSSTLPTDS